MTAAQESGTISFTTSAAHSATFNWFQGGPIDGFWIRLVYTALLGNVNALAIVEALLPDGATWVSIGEDPLGPCNVVGERKIRASMGFYSGSGTWPSTSPVAPVQFRVTIIPNELPDRSGSKNSSSLSSQSFASSSSGGSQAGQAYFYLSPSPSG